MSLLGDFIEAKKYWNKSSFLTKVIIGFSLFMTFSSITSLADEIFKWKGFILNGLEFYRNFVSKPLLDLFTWMKLNYTSDEVDVLIVATIVISAIIRGTYAFKIEWIKKYSALHITNLLFAFYFLSFEDDMFARFSIAILVYLPMFIWYFKGATRISALAIPFMAILLVLILAAINLGLTRQS